jgi:S-adenosylmethionine hydrolase
MSVPPPIVLLTDFGIEGPYVGQMKGILAKLAPDHPVIDLCHTVSPQDVREGAFLLEVSWRHFPLGSVFVAVVDPGVGTERAALVMEAEGRFFVGPDNGLLPGAFPPDASFRAVQLVNEEYRLVSVSSTFHGRDLFAPAGAVLARGIPMEEFGPPVQELVLLSHRFPAVSPEELRGQIVHVDRFGNLVSNISHLILEKWRSGNVGNGALTVRAGHETLQGLKRTYGQVEWGAPLALFGSLGYLEIAVNGGSAAEHLGVRRGEIRVSIER